jgi:HPt (histidine-containing phosphotransfer) domain-containing protein
MKEGGNVFRDVLDQSVLASLRELQDVGDPDIVAEVGGLFVKHSPEKIDAIMQSVEKDDAKGLQLAAHSLKSSSAYIGAMRLSTLAKEMEMMGRTNSLNGAKEKAKMLKEEFSLVMEAILAEIQMTDQSG